MPRSDKDHHRFRWRKWHPWKPNDITKLYQVLANGCWLWKGSVHKATGQPLWKGYKYATRVLFKMHVRALAPNEFIVDRTCATGKLCVCPEHQVLYLRRPKRP